MAESDLNDPEFITALENKLSAARTRLILDKPFIGALALRLPLKVADPAWCPTTGTDARAFYYNPAYIDALRTEEIQFVMAHEALHCALSHFARRQHRVKHRWDLACDFAINPILVAEGLKPPPGLVLMPQYEGMTAEEIYPLLDDNDHSETMDQHLYDKQDNPAEGEQRQTANPLDSQPSGEKSQPSTSPSPTSESDQQEPPDSGEASNASGENQSDEQQQSETQEGAGIDQAQQPESAETGNKQDQSTPPPTLTPDEAEMISQQWQQRLAGAAQQAEMAGKLSGNMQRLISEQQQAELPWRMVLARHLSSTARDDYDYRRPSSRRGNPALFPTLRSAQINLVVAIDVSGSIRDTELAQYFEEINALKGQLRARVTVLACDAELIEGFPLIFDVWEHLELDHKVAGGGSTDFRPVFRYVADLDVRPDAVLYFTDALGIFPEGAPQCEVFWLVKGKGKVSWGERIQFQ